MDYKIGLFGFGTVGRGYYKVSSRDNKGLLPTAIVVKNKEKERGYSLDFSYDPNDILQTDIDIGLELISDVDDALEYVRQLLQSGKKVISANKKLLAAHLPELIQLQKKFGGRLLYEAAVAAGIPIITTLESHFYGDPVYKIEAILNGSSNYILTRLFEDNLSFKDALSMAQQNGFAELDPLLDINGSDVASKLSILGVHAFGDFLKEGEIPTLGIQHIRKEDVKLAKFLGQKIKLLARIEKNGDRYEAFILPSYVKNNDSLFLVENEYNGVKVSSKNLSEQFYKGKGAGSNPTGAAVYGDLNKMIRGYQYNYSKMEGNSLQIKTPTDFPLECIVRTKRLESLYALLGEEIHCFKYDDEYWFLGNISTETLVTKKAVIEDLEISIIALNNTIKPIEIMDIMIQKQNVVDIEKYIH